MAIGALCSTAGILATIRHRVGVTATAYRFNEGDRLARVAATLHRRQLVDFVRFAEWLRSVATPLHMAAWSDAFANPAGMAELHNAKQFMRALDGQIGPGPTDRAVRAALDEVLRQFAELV